jgi:hypothetical protein
VLPGIDPPVVFCQPTRSLGQTTTGGVSRVQADGGADRETADPARSTATISWRPAIVAVSWSLGFLAVVLVVGALAAAFSGALPTNLQNLAHDFLGAPAASSLAPGDGEASDGSDVVDSSGASEFTETPIGESAATASPLGTVELLELCQAYTDAGPDDQSGESVAFKVLSEQASRSDQSIEDFCQPFLSQA